MTEIQTEVNGGFPYFLFHVSCFPEDLNNNPTQVVLNGSWLNESEEDWQRLLNELKQ
jgi:hypothetical protein